MLPFNLLIFNNIFGKYISSLYIFTCSNLDNTFLNRYENDFSNITTTIILFGDQKAERFNIDLLKEWSTTIIYLDISCTAGQEFLIKVGSDRSLFLNNLQWLFHTYSQNDSIEYLEKLKISLDSNIFLLESSDDKIDVYEIYKIHETKNIIYNLIGSFGNDSEYISYRIKSNREDLQGLIMNVTFALFEIKLKSNESLEMLLDNYFYPESARFYRYAYPLFMYLSQISNFTYNYYMVNDWGVEQSPGNWTGMMGILQRGECEFSLQFSKARQDRLNVIDVHHTYKEVRALFLFLQPRTFGSYKALVSPLDPFVWTCTIILCLLLFTTYRIISKYDLSPDLNSLSSIFIYVFGAMAQQGFSETSNAGLESTKVASLFLLLFSYMVCLYYNAAILNGLLSPSPYSITSLDDLVKSNLQLGILDLPYMHDVDSEESIYGAHDALTKRMFKKIFKNDKVFFTLDEGIKKIKNEKFAFFVDDGTIYPLVKKTFTESEICSSYSIVKKPKILAGLTLKKNSPYKELISRKFSWMREVGLWKRNLNVWYPGMPECQWRLEAIPIGIEAVTMAYVVLIFGFFISVFFLIMEIKTNKKNKLQIHFEN